MRHCFSAPLSHHTVSACPVLVTLPVSQASRELSDSVFSQYNAWNIGTECALKITAGTACCFHPSTNPFSAGRDGLTFTGGKSCRQSRSSKHILLLKTTIPVKPVSSSYCLCPQGHKPPWGSVFLVILNVLCHSGRLSQHL